MCIMMRKLDGKIAQGVVSINAFKGVSFGEGFKAAEKPGSEIQDEILYNSEIGYYRASNHLGGLEGGMSNGMPIIVNGVMKPIPTLYKPLNSVDINTKEDFKATIERSDSCAVPCSKYRLRTCRSIWNSKSIIGRIPIKSYWAT